MSFVRRLLVFVMALSLSLGGLALNPPTAHSGHSAHAASGDMRDALAGIEKFADLVSGAMDLPAGLDMAAPDDDERCQTLCAACLTATLAPLLVFNIPLLHREVVLAPRVALAAYHAAADPDIPKVA